MISATLINLSKMPPFDCQLPHNTSRVRQLKAPAAQPHKVWCGGRGTFKPGTLMYVRGMWKMICLLPSEVTTEFSQLHVVVQSDTGKQWWLQHCTGEDSSYPLEQVSFSAMIHSRWSQKGQQLAQHHCPLWCFSVDIVTNSVDQPYLQKLLHWRTFNTSE